MKPKFYFKVVLYFFLIPLSFALLTNINLLASHVKYIDLSYKCLGDADNNGLNEYEFNAVYYIDFCAWSQNYAQLEIEASSVSCNQDFEFHMQHDLSFYTYDTIFNYNYSPSDTSTVFILMEDDLITIDYNARDTSYHGDFFDDIYSVPMYELDTIFHYSTGNIAKVVIFLNGPAASGDILTCSDANVLILRARTEISPVCANELDNTSCISGTLEGTKKYKFKKVVEMPAQCNDWLIEWSVTTRGAAISNLQDPEQNDFFVYTTVNNLGENCYNSPQFKDQIPPYYCINTQCLYNPSTYEMDGSDLHYSLINPMFSSTFNGPYPLPFANGYDALNPITTATGINLDSTSGKISFIPIQEELCVATFLIERFDSNQNLVASSIKDVLFTLFNCENTIPEIGSIFNLSPGNSLIDTYSIETCPENLISFELEISDIDSLQILSLQNDIETNIPGAIFNLSGTNPVTFQFEWMPGFNAVGRYNFNLEVNDDNCPYYGYQSQIISITILPAAYAGEDKFYCDMGSSIKINPVGGDNFSWTSNQIEDGIIFASNNGDNLIVTPAQTTSYFLESNTNSGCSTFDTVTIYKVSDFSYTLPKHQSLCYRTELELNLEVDSQFDSYSYQWSPDKYLSTSNIQKPICRPLEDMTYTYEITADNGCLVRDSIQINIDGLIPFAQIDKDIDSNICIDENVALSLFKCCEDCEINTNIHSSSGPGPFKGTLDEVKRQYHIKKEELRPILKNGCPIWGIAFEVKQDNNVILFYNFTVSLKNKDIRMFTYDTEVSDEGLQVFHDNYNPILGWTELHFNKPFYWDYNQDLLLTIRHGNPNGPSGNDCSVASHFSGSYLGECNIGNGVYRPNIKILTSSNASNPISYTWTEAESLNNAHISNPIASPEVTTTYTLTASSENCSTQDSITLHVQNCAVMDTATIQEDSLLYKSAELIDLQGRLVNANLPINNNKVELNNLNLPMAIYILRLETIEGKLVSKKVYID